MIPSGGILGLKSKTKKINNEYLTLALNSILVKKQVNRDVGGSVIFTLATGPGKRNSNPDSLRRETNRNSAKSHQIIIVFLTDLELLHYALDRADLNPDRIYSCSLRSAVVDYRDKDNPINLIKSPRINQDGSVHANDEADVIKLDQLSVSGNRQHCFAGIFEIIYQVRNMLVHGKINPAKDGHDVVKYCYRILRELMN